ncbi:hypothetical protein CYMTET_52708 [Cymbomonas tetramitiformis]|uniref:Uncharacterized protein n=1 Tax=Cymbomonas tetramitiformis TaxID=36881 RepID=A0AAE0BK81_9CHLO|nr:hypothetical protein CYMTET_52708 [Cymbomonas tetramitiformis]
MADFQGFHALGRGRGKVSKEYLTDHSQQRDSVGGPAPTGRRTQGGKNADGRGRGKGRAVNSRMQILGAIQSHTAETYERAMRDANDGITPGARAEPRARALPSQTSVKRGSQSLAPRGAAPIAVTPSSSTTAVHGRGSVPPRTNNRLGGSPVKGRSGMTKYMGKAGKDLKSAALQAAETRLADQMREADIHDDVQPVQGPSASSRDPHINLAMAKPSNRARSQVKPAAKSTACRAETAAHWAAK